ncbi:hypothetical protein PHLCEN_2v9503 [Hermanssonia centrifuga]|uniref:Uncharacterized protein n=1 Tax=Hermanssonia centrifuga TaxID=98765 RepID=A0A2R6NQJ9_9APHY|nr:hypothetical protein PHLCEN_2v9503 [Hermanssonia centrifuga]
MLLCLPIAVGEAGIASLAKQPPRPAALPANRRRRGERSSRQGEARGWGGEARQKR